ncbi:MAG: TIGR03960 family B12-binding radical SAM protein [Eubacteriales bacterium]|nr:TIGR03960 family B12-binding radical SAM protein [Eubacteriales bacterium]
MIENNTADSATDSQDTVNMSQILKSVSKPGRYIGGEFNQIIKDKSSVDVRFAFCFPDTYEIGMSNLGVRILYDCLNSVDNVWCERVYAPWIDMESKMREYNIPLTAMESGDKLTEFDFVAFTLQYELCYTTALHMIKMTGIPLFSCDRREDDPIILGGGPCSYNAEPVADFFDVFSIGEGEEALPEACALYSEMKKNGTYTRKAYLHELAKIDGFYVPSLYKVSYNADNTIEKYTPLFDDIPIKIKKRIVEDMDKSRYPEKFVMPYIETVHDRIVLEVYRGCIRGCRFCQAGMIYRPIREKSPNVLCRQAKCLYENTGYDEISLIALSISDYSKLDELTLKMLEWTDEEKVNLSLPSLRIDSFSKELMDRVSGVRTGGLTFAPEAGTQRLRDVINKNVTEEDLLRSVNIAFESGKSNVKLYFMNGLPTETLEDISGIAELAKKVVDAYYQNPKRNKSRGVSVTISVSCFVPKPFTPFQWEAQDDIDTLIEKQKYLRDCITDRKITYNWHEAKVSFLETVFARGDRRLSKALKIAADENIMFDAWNECFDYDRWMDIFSRAGIEPKFYANRKLGFDEVLPWDIIDCGVTKEYLKRERDNAYNEKTTPSCAQNCNGCGANRLGGKNRWCK